MDFGMPTLVELANTERNAALCAELGLRFVELNMNLPEYADVAGIDRSLLRSLAEKYGVYFTLHLDERMDVCDFNPLVRAAISRFSGTSPISTATTSTQFSITSSSRMATFHAGKLQKSCKNSLCAGSIKSASRTF